MGGLAAWVAVRGTTGTVLVGAVLVIASAGIYALSRRKPVTADNVNELPVDRPPKRVLWGGAAAKRGGDPQVKDTVEPARAAA
jgi:hypothetical protein